MPCEKTQHLRRQTTYEIKVYLHYDLEDVLPHKIQIAVTLGFFAEPLRYRYIWNQRFKLNGIGGHHFFLDWSPH